MPQIQPSYIRLHETGELEKRIGILMSILEDCAICPWDCRVNRVEGKKGVCKAGYLPMVSSFTPHFGEESPLVGRGGSGTIFLSYCNLKCLFCQNFDISHLGHGSEVSFDELSGMMVTLQQMGCHNINFVTPTHQIAQIVKSLPKAIERGLSVPLVYNCGGYESSETIKLLDGIFDIYMPDIKYGDNETAKKYSSPKDYWDRVREAVKEMHCQAGDLKVDKNGIAERGLIIRHLILPEGLAGTQKVMRFIAGEISKNSYVNIMDQYRPCFKASEHPPLDRRITAEEFEEATRVAREEGLWRFSGITE